ncbi:hypothetical protein A6A04_00010 [Paramagnetospirillum marisnigri]|uniref:Uncharacterized protein n=1 Tax=Paramagnetospirillum marisnigri TaxID=1285242 RepID=A0A178MTQ3_9PROT|nr:hypothetical protein A6A04_00010 [Paramagnetospirillum marisnigri]
MLSAPHSHPTANTQLITQARYDVDIRYDGGSEGEVSGWGMLLWIGLWVGAWFIWGRKGR